MEKKFPIALLALTAFLMVPAPSNAGHFVDQGPDLGISILPPKLVDAATGETFLVQVKPGDRPAVVAPVIQPPGPATGSARLGPGTAFTCDSEGGACFCVGVPDCVKLSKSGQCAGDLKCDDDGCECPWNP